MHTTMVLEQVKTKKIQAGVQVSRLEEKDVIFSIGSALDVTLFCLYFVLVRKLYLLGASTTIMHSAGVMVLLRSVTIPPPTRNLSSLWAVDGTAWIFLRPGRPMILLYGDGDLTTIKFIKAFTECSSSPKDTISDICPKDQDISPLNPKSGVVARITQLLTSEQSLLKQCSYNTSDWVTLPARVTCGRGIEVHLTNRFITIGFSCLSLFARGGKEISRLRRSFAVILCIMDAFICAVTLIPVELENVFLCSVLRGFRSSWWGALNFTFPSLPEFPLVVGSPLKI
ncbi:hypothetical protein Tco_0566033 [Tanacetum coccineum]